MKKGCWYYVPFAAFFLISSSFLFSFLTGGGAFLTPCWKLTSDNAVGFA